MDVEKLNREYKSLKKAIGDKANLRGLAETCVCLANGQGGKLYIGCLLYTSPSPRDRG